MPRHGYPEHEKMAAVAEDSQVIGGFLEWLSASSQWSDACAELGKIEDMLASYFKIDLRKIESEKREMLKALRNAHGGK